MKTNDAISMGHSSISRVALGTIAALSIPLIAMQFTDEVDWNLADFIIMGTLLFSIGTAYVLLAKKAVNKEHRVVIGLVLAVTLFIIWAELAVGIFGTPFAGS